MVITPQDTFFKLIILYHRVLTAKSSVLDLFHSKKSFTGQRDHMNIV